MLILSQPYEFDMKMLCKKRAEPEKQPAHSARAASCFLLL